MTDTREGMFEHRTYGGWRRQRGIGFFGLSQGESIVFFITGCVVMFCFAYARWFLIPSIIIAAFILGSMFRIDGLPLWSHLYAEYRLLITAALGRGEFVSRYFSNNAENAGSDLPGALAPTRTFEVKEPSGNKYGVVWNDALKTATVTWRVHPHTPHLADQKQIDIWVSSWHQYLASLGYIDQIDHIAVNVITATEPGAIVAENLASSRAANAPVFAKELLDELAVRETDGTTFSQTLISATFDTRKGPAARDKNPVRRIEHVVGLVQAMTQDIRLSGLASINLLPVAELSVVTKGAFAPSLRKPLTEAFKRGEDAALQWRFSGPTKATAERFYYRHDDAITLGWYMSQAPRGHVTEGVLYNLMSPGTFPKRVTFVWNPIPADQAARIIENERTMSEARRLVKDKSLSDESARDEYDRQMADMAAADEARGAGLGNFMIFVSTTLEVSDDITDEQLDHAMDTASVEIESRAKQSKLILKPAMGFHDLVFFASLPAGINPTTLRKRRRSS